MYAIDLKLRGIATSISDLHEETPVFVTDAAPQASNGAKPVFACAEQARLRDRYYKSIAAYRQMVTLLDSLSSYGDFVETYERAEEVRLLFERASAELLKHVQEHGCEMESETISYAPGGFTAT